MNRIKVVALWGIVIVIVIFILFLWIGFLEYYIDYYGIKKPKQTSNRDKKKFINELYRYETLFSGKWKYTFKYKGEKFYMYKSFGLWEEIKIYRVKNNKVIFKGTGQVQIRYHSKNSKYLFKYYPENLKGLGE